MNKLKILSIIALLSLVGIANAQKKSAKAKDLKEVVKPFYTQCLTVNTNTNTDEVLSKLLDDNFQSINTMETKGKQQLMGQIKGFWKLIPDLKWEIQEMIQSGNQVIVRSIATGSPKGSFMGMELDGSKSFKIMTIDIHTIEKGKIIKVYHIEEWATAMKQLKG